MYYYCCDAMSMAMNPITPNLTRVGLFYKDGCTNYLASPTALPLRVEHCPFCGRGQIVAKEGPAPVKDLTENPTDLVARYENLLLKVGELIVEKLTKGAS